MKLNEPGEKIVDFHTLPAVLAAPFLLAIILSLLIPSKASKRARITGYYSSSLVGLVYFMGGVIFFSGLAFVLLFFLDRDMFSVEFFIANMTFYPAAGIAIVLQNFIAVRRSRKTALAGGIEKGEVAFISLAQEEIMEIQPMVVEELDDD